MQTIIKHPTGLYSLDKAKRIAEGLQKGDLCGWSYRVHDCNNGMGRIDVYDEENQLVEKGFLYPGA